MASTAFNLSDGHRIRLLTGSGEMFPALVATMDAARSEIRLESYIFDFAGDGILVAEALMRAAQRGVMTCVLVDGVGTGVLPAPWPGRFLAAGVQWRVYSPLGPLGLLIPLRWRRLHRKLCVIDGREAFCGGINILDDFHDPGHGPQSLPRLDFAVQVQGALVRHVQATVIHLWWRAQVLQVLLRRRNRKPPFKTLKKTRQSRLNWVRWPRIRVASVPQAGKGAALLLRDNVRHRHDIERAYLDAIGAARHEIVIANAYFLPGRKLRHALVEAARRGVRVRLLLQGRYEYFMQFHAARPVLGLLLAAGIEVHEYAAAFLHAKVAVIDADGDNPWATVGSSNLDPLSLLLAREANIVVRDAAFAADLRARLDAVMSGKSTRLAASDDARRPWSQRLLDRVALGLMRLALFLTGRDY